MTKKGFLFCATLISHQVDARDGIRTSSLKLNFSPCLWYTDIPEPGLFQFTLVKLLCFILTVYPPSQFYQIGLKLNHVEQNITNGIVALLKKAVLF